MIELLSIALKHSNIILNSIFIGAFILTYYSPLPLFSWKDVLPILSGLGY